MSKNAANLWSPSAYNLWTAPFGTALPTTPIANPGASFYEVGVLSDAGIGESRNLNENKVYDMVGQLQAIIRNQEERPFTFAALEDNRVVRELRYPGSTLSTAAGTSEVQTITATGTPAGNFTLSGGIGSSATTGTISATAASSTVQTAVRTLPGLSTATVSGSSGGPYTITFPAAYGDVVQLTVDNSALTGGTFAVATSTPGVASVNTRVVLSGTGQNRRVWWAYASNGTKAQAFGFTNAEAVQTGTVTRSASGVLVSEFTLNPYPDPTTGAFFTLIDNDGAQGTSVAFA